MRSFEVGAYRIDILSHVRVMGEDFPRPDPGAISEWFQADIFKDGLPLDLYPNQVPHPHPTTPNHLTIGWVGRESVPIAGGTKVGADFRSRFWLSVMLRILKADGAANQGVRIGQLADSDLPPMPPLPNDFRNRTREQAIQALTGNELVIGRRIPHGSVANIDVDFDSTAIYQGGTTYSEDETSVGLIVRFDTAPGSAANSIKRLQLRFPLASIASATAINDVVIQGEEASETVEAGEDVNVYAYNATGDDDPDGDTAETKYNRSIGGSVLAQLVGNTAGTKSVDLGASADTIVAGNLSSPGFVSFGLADDGEWEDAEQTTWAALEATSTAPFILIVDYTAPTAALTGTITASVTESDIVAGGKTLIITLTDDTWIAAGAGSFDLQRDEIIAGCDSAQSEATGWDLVPKLSQSLGGVVRTSDTVVTITWDAFATYNITAQETITVTVPATAVTGGNPIVATPTFTIDTAGGTVVKDIISLGFIVFPR